MTDVAKLTLEMARNGAFTSEQLVSILLDQERRIAELERRLSFKSEPLNEALLREARRAGVRSDE